MRGQDSRGKKERRGKDRRSKHQQQSTHTTAPHLMLRRLLSTSAAKMDTVPPLTKLVQQSMQNLYPLALADRSWDNVGLLLEPPYPKKRQPLLLPKVMLTIDLTTPVVMESLASSKAVETIVTYRLPLIVV